jgi:retron-type reverse transcriptase
MAARRVQDLLNNPNVSVGHIIELHIEGFFDNIDHDYIMDNIPVIPRNILKEWLKSGFIVSPTCEHYPTNPWILQNSYGVPQGGIISPIISNMVLDGIDLNKGIKAISLTTPNPKGVGGGVVRLKKENCFKLY